MASVATKCEVCSNVLAPLDWFRHCVCNVREAMRDGIEDYKAKGGKMEGDWVVGFLGEKLKSGNPPYYNLLKDLVLECVRYDDWCEKHKSSMTFAEWNKLPPLRDEEEDESEDEGEWECSKCGAIGHDEVKECEIRMEEEAVCDYCHLYAKDGPPAFAAWLAPSEKENKAFENPPICCGVGQRGGCDKPCDKKYIGNEKGDDWGETNQFARHPYHWNQCGDCFKKESGEDESESEDEGEWECERCGEGGKANDGAIKCRCGEEGVWSDDEAVCEEECVAWDDNGRCKRCGTKGGRAMMTAVVTETMTAAQIEAGGGIQAVVTAWMNVKLK